MPVPQQREMGQQPLVGCPCDQGRWRRIPQLGQDLLGCSGLAVALHSLSVMLMLLQQCLQERMFHLWKCR